MKTKKIVIAVLMATVLISAALIIGCMDEFNELSLSGEDVESEDNYQAPEGKGLVRFKVGDSEIDNKLTILPNFDKYTTSGNNIAKMYFDVKFTNLESDTGDAHYGEIVYFPHGATPANPATTKATYTEFYNKPIPLTLGEKYSFVITAYNVAAGTIPIAKYTSVSPGDDIIVSSSTIAKGPYTLTAVIDSTKTGDFVYNISIPDDTDYTNTTNLIEIELVDSGSPQYVDMSGGDSSTDPGRIIYSNTISLNSGYYLVTFKLEKDNYLSKKYVEAVHIYPGMESKMEWTPSALVKNTLEVSFDLNSESNDNASYDPAIDGKTQNIVYGFTASPPANNPTNASKNFLGWSDDDTDDGTNLWVFTNKIFKDTTLYAIWKTPDAPSASFKIIMEAFEDAMANATPSGASIDAYGNTTHIEMDGTNQIQLALDPPDNPLDTWEDITWTVAGVASLASFDNVDTLTITNAAGGDFSGLFLNADIYEVYVTAKLNSGGPTYSAKVSFTITRDNGN